jgi:hypothetical protein
MNERHKRALCPIARNVINQLNTAFTEIIQSLDEIVHAKGNMVKARASPFN